MCLCPDRSGRDVRSTLCSPIVRIPDRLTPKFESGITQPKAHSQLVTSDIQGVMTLSFIHSESGITRGSHSLQIYTALMDLTQLIRQPRGPSCSVINVIQRPMNTNAMEQLSQQRRRWTHKQRSRKLTLITQHLCHVSCAHVSSTSGHYGEVSVQGLEVSL
eukprot:Blabericola_migrator_1__4322@NODE_2328_length_2930_cov_19_548725_g1459_i0_p2_GENE_NODE_2328_length_2930_cov_19_548725_g1459_i0NODE_2328_length_2930_cov_19_548725_g1459_i0_p2_ORF_typecomplete_len161_score8_72_NODE_2328_length_2930_cov_19_548725_g1459_i08861368